MAISRRIESQTGWPGKFACTTRRYRTIETQASPGDLHNALEAINHAR